MKRWYSGRVISFSRVTKTGTRLNLAPSRTIVSTNSTTVNAAVSASAVSLNPKRFGIKRTPDEKTQPHSSKGNPHHPKRFLNFTLRFGQMG